VSEEQYVALPKLYGAPAYARPPKLVPDSPRPVDVDDLPLEAFRDEPDGGLLMSASADGSNGNGHGDGDGHETIQARPFSLKTLSRFLSSKS
jgi:hypothetical protein